MNNYIQFQKIHIKNFLSIADVTLDFENLKGMNYVHGINEDLDNDNEDKSSNGSGKSTLMVESLLFALFNKMTKDITKKSIPHRLEKGDCFVELNFKVNNDQYRVKNCIKPSSYELYKIVNNEEINLSKSSSKETLSYFHQDILKCSFDVFKISLILSSSVIPNIYDMKKGEKRTFIENTMDIAHIGRMFIRAKEIHNDLERKIIDYRNMFNNAEKQYKYLTEEKSNFEQVKNNNIISLNKQLSDIQKEIIELKTDMNHIQVMDVTLLKQEQEKFQNDKNDIQENINKINQAIIKIQSNIDNNNNAIGLIKKSFDKYQEVLDIICDSCKNLISNDLIKDDSDIKKQENEELKKKLELIKSKKVAFDVSLKSLDEKIKLNKQLITKNEYDVMTIKRFQNEYNLKVQSEKSFVEQIDREKQKVFSFENKIIELFSEMEKYKKQLDETEQERQYWSMIVGITSENGVRKTLLTDFVEILNNRIQKYLEQVGCEYVPVFKEDFSCDFLTTSGPCEYGNFSTGERGRIDVTTMLSFRDIVLAQGIIRSNILVCDEILDNKGMDKVASLKFLDVLRNISKEQCMFLVSHKECFEPDQFDRVIEVCKKNGRTIVNDI